MKNGFVGLDKGECLKADLLELCDGDKDAELIERVHAAQCDRELVEAYGAITIKHGDVSDDSVVEMLLPHYTLDELEAMGCEVTANFIRNFLQDEEMDEKKSKLAEIVLKMLDYDDELSETAKKVNDNLLDSSALLELYFSLGQSTFLSDSDMFDELTDIFTQADLEKLGFGDYCKDYFDEEYLIPVAWMMSGLLKVKANSLEEAYRKARTDEEDYMLPEGCYVDGSFAVDELTIEEISVMYNDGRN